MTTTGELESVPEGVPTRGVTDPGLDPAPESEFNSFLTILSSNSCSNSIALLIQIIDGSDSIGGAGSTVCDDSILYAQKISKVLIFSAY